MGTYNVHGGHSPKAPGASGQFSEVTEDRKVKNLVISKLRSLGHTVYDCTDDAGATANQNLANIVKKCNQHTVDLDISIHFNAFNGSAHGSEVFQYDSQTNTVATNILNAICALGFTRRGVKNGSGLYVIKNTKSKAILIECCFCDSATDARIYNAESMATAIVKGITGKTVGSSGSSSSGSSSSSSSEQMYRIRKSWSDAKSQVGAYRNLESAKSQCPNGYNVYDKDGKVVYSNGGSTTSTTTDKLYRVRKSWSDAKSQLGAYAVLDNAKNNCPTGYTVYDWNGKAVYSNAASTPVTTDQLYRVRKSWSDAKSQLGAYKILDNAKASCPAGYSVFDWNGKVVYAPSTSTTTPEKPVTKPENPTTPETPIENISPLEGMDHDAFIAYVGSIAKADAKESGILPSIVVAQAILESAWGQSELSLKANNLFGMKASLSGNTWESDWDGKIYSKSSPEDDGKGNITQVVSDFRMYANPTQSIKDHSDYLCGAKNGSALRYEGLFGETDYRTAAQIIKDGGYATDSKYVDKLCNIIEENDLDVFDYEFDPEDLEDMKTDVEEIKKDTEEIKSLLQVIIDLINKVISFFTKK